MRVCIRAHDLGVKGTEDIISRARELGIDGLQLVCYKSFEDIPYAPGGITPERAREIGGALRGAGLAVPLVGAYFNPVHSDLEKRARCTQVFAEYLSVAKALGSEFVGSETGSYNDDKWTYNPKNHSMEAIQTVTDTFSALADRAAEHGVNVAMEGAAAHVSWCPDTLNLILTAMNKPNVRVIFDLYNYMDAENQLEYMDILEHGLEIFKGRILLFHMKDCILGEKGVTAPKQVGFGRGDLDKTEILRSIKAQCPDATLVLEGTTGEDIPFAVNTLREIWEKV